MLLFVLIFILTNIIFSLVIYDLFYEIKKKSPITKEELFLFSLGIGPALTSLLLYYLFLVIPKRSDIEYLLIVIIFYCTIFVVSIFKTIGLPINIFDLRTKYFAKYNSFMIIFVGFITLLILIDLTKIISNPIIGHDPLVYGYMGKLLYTEKSLDPIWVDDFSGRGFIYKVSMKPPSYSLLLTWEKIIGSLFNKNIDLYYKSTSIYFSILILSIVCFLLSKYSLPCAILGVLALLVAPDYLMTLLRPHLDSLRIYFQSISIIFLYYSMKSDDNFSLFMLGLFSGFAVFTHTIGTVVACLNVIIFFIFSKKSLGMKILKTGYIVGNIFIFGASYHIFNLVWGKNWLF